MKDCGMVLRVRGLVGGAKLGTTDSDSCLNLVEPLLSTLLSFSQSLTGQTTRSKRLVLGIRMSHPAMSHPFLICQAVQSCGTSFRVISSEEEGSVRSLSPLSDGEGQVTEDAEPIQPLNNYHRSTVRFPCKARGVPDTHNARSAYIDIPSTAEHGTILICSHPFCGSSGRRFRYCAVCQLPVAKRNFTKRHAHGVHLAPVFPEEEPVGIKLEDDASSTHSIGKRQRLNSNGDARRFDDTSHPLVHKKESFEEVPYTVVVEPAPSVSNSEATLTSTELTEKERQWLDLYRSRPLSLEHEQNFREWMDAIIEAADFREEQEDGLDVDNVETYENYLSLLLEDVEVNQGE